MPEAARPNHTSEPIPAAQSATAGSAPAVPLEGGVRMVSWVRTITNAGEALLAGAHCDAQVLVWQDMAGLRAGRAPRFGKRCVDMASVLTEAVGTYVDEVRNGTFPEPERSFD